MTICALCQAPRTSSARRSARSLERPLFRNSQRPPELAHPLSVLAPSDSRLNEPTSLLPLLLSVTDSLNIFGVYIPCRIDGSNRHVVQLPVSRWFKIHHSDYHGPGGSSCSTDRLRTSVFTQRILGPRQHTSSHAVARRCPRSQACCSCTPRPPPKVSHAYSCNGWFFF